MGEDGCEAEEESDDGQAFVHYGLPNRVSVLKETESKPALHS